jgi:hypothetical protein
VGTGKLYDIIIIISQTCHWAVDLDPWAVDLDPWAVDLDPWAVDLE